MNRNNNQTDVEIVLGTYAPARWSLAERTDLQPNIVRLLLDSQDEDAIRHLAENESMSPEVLAEIFTLYPDLLPIIAANRNSPLEIKFKLPAAEHGERYLWTFLDQVNASDQERIELLKKVRKMPPPGGPLLGEVWHNIRPND